MALFVCKLSWKIWAKNIIQSKQNHKLTFYRFCVDKTRCFIVSQLLHALAPLSWKKKILLYQWMLADKFVTFTCNLFDMSQCKECCGVKKVKSWGTWIIVWQNVQKGMKNFSKWKTFVEHWCWQICLIFSFFSMLMEKVWQKSLNCEGKIEVKGLGVKIEINLFCKLVLKRFHIPNIKNLNLIEWPINL